MASMKDPKDRWVRSFLVDETRQHRRGFTLYKITSYVFPRSAPETITVVTVWKRYSEIQKLQRKMKKMHGELYLLGTCPNFAKWSYFRRFDPEVVEERMTTTQNLLEFVAIHAPLYNSSEFVTFFQSSHPDPSGDNEDSLGNIESIRHSLLLPTEAPAPIEYPSSEEDSFSIFDSSASTADTVSVDSSVIRKKKSIKKTTVKQIANDNSFNDTSQPPSISSSSVMDTSASESLNDIIFGEIKIDQNGSVPTISLDNGTNMEASGISVESADNIGFSSLWSDLKNNEEKLISQSASDGGEDTVENQLNASSSITRSDRTVSSAQSVTSFFSGRKQSTSETQGENKLQEKLDHADGLRSKESTSETNSSLTRSSSQLDTLSIDFSSFADLQENYVFEAGYLLSLGARNEAKGEYQKAFDCYKAGIEKMLIGVQGDSNDLRRKFVKDKTTKYLSHAEKLYNTYLNDASYEAQSIRKSDNVMTKEDVKKKSSDLSRPYNELGKYRVLSVMDGQVLLVFSSDTQECHVMKVIQKTCNQVPDDEYFTKGFVDSKLPILPMNIPYMVKLISYIETPNLLFLVSQYATGGKLFDYINKHAKTVPNTPSREVNLDNVFVDPTTVTKSFSKINANAILPLDLIESADLSTLKNSKGSMSETDQSKIDSNLNFDNGDNQVFNKQDDENAQDLSVTDIVIKSQRLLLNVDEALSGKFLDKKDSIENINSNNGDKLSLMVSEVEQAFNGIQEKLNKIVYDKSSPAMSVPKNVLPPKTICKWGAELLTAIDHLHRQGVICRTLNPNNLLLGDRGQLMLSYIVGRDFHEFLVPLLNMINANGINNVYIAPELQQFSFNDDSQKFDEKACDFWSYGVLMYELIIGLPLVELHPTRINSHTIINFPSDVPKEVESFLTKLLCFNPQERLGSAASGIDEIKFHPYFNHIDWTTIEEEFFNDRN